MELNSLIISIASMGGLGFLFAAGLSLAHKKLYVEEDPRISLVLDELPGANCGGCGYPGCASFAENLVSGDVNIGGCPVSGDEAIEEVGNILGIKVEKRERKIARILCQGGIYETARKATYDGIKTCIAATLVNGGDKLCRYGCIGFGDCVQVCPFGAIKMDENGLPVVDSEKCTGDGNCVDACPRGIIELHPESHQLFVLCKNEDAPKEARKACLTACIGCGICVRAVEEEQIVMENNLAIINYDLYSKEPVLPTEKCPTNCLVVIPKETPLEVKALA